MLNVVRWCLLAALFAPGAVLAEGGFDPFAPVPAPLTEGQKRRLLVPVIRAATDCIAARTMANPGVNDAYRALNLWPILSPAWDGCVTELGRVAVQHDTVHGPGTGIPFVKGPYKDDLARAVLQRIKPEMDRRFAELDRIEGLKRAEEVKRLAEQERLEAQRRADQERLDAVRRAEQERLEAQRQAERERQEAQRRIDQERLEAERRVEVARLEARRQAEEERLKRNADSARDAAYSCTESELVKTVTSGEGAETLATAAMFSCRADVSNALETRLDLMRFNARVSYSEADTRSTREDMRRMVRERVLTDAVKVKSALNAPIRPLPSTAPAAPTPQPSTPPPTVPASLPITETAEALPSVGKAVADCLATVNTAQKGKFVERQKLLDTMVDLCRPEVETLARDRYLADTSLPLDRHREAALTATMKVATGFVDGPTGQP